MVVDELNKICYSKVVKCFARISGGDWKGMAINMELEQMGVLKGKADGKVINETVAELCK